MGLTARVGFPVARSGCLLGRPVLPVRLLSISELLGTLRGRAEEDSVTERRECEEEEVRIERREEAEVRELLEEVEWVEDRGGTPRDREASLRVWVLVGRGAGQGDTPPREPETPTGDTVSRRNM